MKKLFLLLALMGIVAIGCSKDEGGNIPDDAYISLNKEIVTISPDGESVDVKVYSNYAWELTNNCDWVTTSITSGDASDTGVTVTLTTDLTYDDREGTIVFSCGKAKKLLVVSQKLKEVIIPDANNTFNIPAEGGIAVISYQTSVDCEIIIPEEAQDWITIAPASRGLVSESITLNIAENTTYSSRTAVVKVVAKDNVELAVEYTINQEQKDGVLADENNTFTVPSAGGEIIINYQTNVDCEVIIPEEAQDWMTIVPETRGLVAQSATLHIAENTTYDSRSAVIKVVAKDNAELAIEYTINQEQNDAVLADENNTFTVPSAGGEVVINYQTNIDCDVIIPEEAQDWITITPATRGLVAYNTTLNITANYSGELRSSVIKVVSQEDNELFAEYTITQNLMYYLCYTSSNGKVVEPYSSTSFGATILSNTYKDGVGIIEFNAPITQIGDYAFDGCSCLTSVTIPNSVTTIGNYAFAYCYNLTSVTIPDSVTYIGEGAFVGCSSLQEFNGKFASEDGRCLIVDGILNYFAPAGLTEYTIPDSVTTIGRYAFRSCNSLTSITIPDSVTSIGDFAFSGCTSELIINSKIVENNYTSKPSWLSGAKFTKLTIGDSVTTIVDRAFDGCESLTSVTIPDSVTMIGEGVFYGCSSLTSITIPNSVTSIGKMAFDGCSSLTSVTIPDSVTTIGDHVFSGCRSLTSVTIPDSVTTIGNSAFEGCSGLTSVYCKAITPPVVTLDYYGHWDAFYDNASGRKIYVPMESVEAYKTAEGWWEYASSIEGYNF